MGRELRAGETKKVESTVCTKLQEGFYKAIEERFDLMSDLTVSETGYRRDEIMIELSCVGKVLSQEAVDTVSSHFSLGLISAS
jgi:hypothetical protein